MYRINLISNVINSKKFISRFIKIKLEDQKEVFKAAREKDIYSIREHQFK